MRDLAILQAGLALILCLWLAAGRPPGRGDFLWRAAAAWLGLAGLSIAGIWLALPLISLLVLAELMVAATAIGAWRLRRRARPIGPVRIWGGRIVAALVSGFALWLLAPAIAGGNRPAQAVDLAFPMRGGRYLVVNGGATERVNGHLMTLEPRYARWRGESYAVDLIKVDSYGFRTRERRLFAMPADPAAYLTFGEPVHAPCAGRVEAVEAGRPDMPVPQRDREHLEGNFVLLRCAEAMVFLGHFRKGDVRVAPGQRVSTGQLLGSVGNSGNCDEPHLHIHAQTPGPAGAPLSGKPLFATYDGAFLIRNMVVRPASDPDSDR